MKQRKKFSSVYYRILCALIFFLSHPLPTLTITNAASPGDIDASADRFSEFQAFSSQLSRSPFLSTNQQNQILRDVQQHQHRFQFNQPPPPTSSLSSGVHQQLHQSASILFPHSHSQNPQQTLPIAQQNNVNTFQIPAHQQNTNIPLQVNIGQQQFSRQPQTLLSRPTGVQQTLLSPTFQQQQNYVPQATGTDQQFDFKASPVESPNIKGFIPRFQQQDNSKPFISLRPQSPDNYNTRTLIPQPDRPIKNYIHPSQNDQSTINNVIPQSNDQTGDLNNYLLQSNQNNINTDNFGQTDLYQSIVRNTFSNNNQPPLEYVFEPAPTRSPSQLTTKKSIIYHEPPQYSNTEQKFNKNILYQPVPNKFEPVSTPRIPEASTAVPTVLYSRSTVRPKTTQTYTQKPVVRIITTEKPVPSATERSSQIIAKPDSQAILQQLIEAHQQSIVQTPKPERASNIDEDNFDLEKHLRAFQKDDLLKTLPGGAVITSDQLSSLTNGQLLQGNDSSPLFLGNGQKFKIIQVPNKPSDNKIPPQIKTLYINQPPSSVKSIPTTTTTIKPPKVVFDELTKDVLPPGADYEVIRQKSDGGLEEVGKIPPNLQKKVTFVILEEQPDGSVKVQGVRGNENDPKNAENKEADVDNILKKIKEGEIKLPPSTKLSKGSVQTSFGSKYSNSSPQESVESPSYVKHSQSDKIKFRPTPAVKVTNNGGAGSQFVSSTGSYNNIVQSTLAPSTVVTPSSSIVKQYARPSSTPSSNLQSHNHVFSTTAFPNTHAGPTFSVPVQQDQQQFSTQRPPQVQYKRPWPSSVSANINKSPPAFLPTPTTDYDYDSSLSTNSVTQSTQPPNVVITKVPPTIRYQSHHQKHHNHNHLPASIPIPSTTTTTSTTTTQTTTTSDGGNYYYDSSNQETFNDVLKKNGLFAMARFLRQSGLDTILNETGPYTVFVPTDRAFRALQVQLGGPDKAEEKFQENPRLLSGLLLHHVVPGAFTVESLQDEMTGVSLAGTQLRVNSYTTQDIEWNDVKVLTVNGAKIVTDKKNILIPQGVAHAVDRVMFPLPVGDLYQTLRSDRDNRFTHFLKAVSDSGLMSMLTGTKVYTVFAPVDTAFTTEKLDTIQSKEAAKRFVLRHLTPGTLYSAGMRYYQLRNSMENSTHLTLYKEAGHVKVNSAHVLTRNIPATNGVVHAIDALL